MVKAIKKGGLSLLFFDDHIIIGARYIYIAKLTKVENPY